MKHESIFYTTLEVSGKGEQTQLDKSLSTIAAALMLIIEKIVHGRYTHAPRDIDSPSHQCTRTCTEK